MDGLPANTDFSALLGRFIGMIRIAKYQLHYLLEADLNKPDAWIEIESNDITYVDADGSRTVINDLRNGAGLLCRPLGLSIVDITRTDRGGIIISLSNGTRLEVGIHTAKYESIVLHIGDKAI